MANCKIPFIYNFANLDELEEPASLYAVIVMFCDAFIAAADTCAVLVNCKDLDEYEAAIGALRVIEEAERILANLDQEVVCECKAVIDNE